METTLVNIKLSVYLLIFFLAGLTVFPLLYKRIPVLVSPYSKVGSKSRAIALMLDIFIPLPLLYLLYIVSGDFWLSSVFFSLYFSFRDALFGRRSFGKFLTGLLIIRLEDGKPADLKRLVIRNAIFIVPGANLAGIMWESAFVYRDKAGYRLGDKLAQTQVVQGKRVPELASYIWEGLLQRLLCERLRFDQRLREVIPPPKSD